MHIPHAGGVRHQRAAAALAEIAISEAAISAAAESPLPQIAISQIATSAAAAAQIAVSRVEQIACVEPSWHAAALLPLAPPLGKSDD